MTVNLTSVTYFRFEAEWAAYQEVFLSDEAIVNNTLAAINRDGYFSPHFSSVTSTPTVEMTSEKHVIGVSVVIPVYMVEKYIEKCVVSLMCQTLGDKVEFIFVDDLGTDASMDIVERYARLDSRIRIVRNQEHQGTGASRNAGIEAARGEYLGFVDPDDWISPSFYEALYSAAKQGDYDIVKGKMIQLTENYTQYTPSKLNDKIRKKINKQQKYMKEDSNSNNNNNNNNNRINIFELFTHQHQTALYRKSLVEASGRLIRYGETYSAQDITFLLTYGYFARSMACVDDARYYYYVRHDSVSNNFSFDFLRGDFESMNDRFNFIEDRGLSISDFPAYRKRCTKMAKLRYKQLMSLKKQVDPKDFDLLKSYALATMDRLNDSNKYTYMLTHTNTQTQTQIDKKMRVT